MFVYAWFWGYNSSFYIICAYKNMKKLSYHLLFDRHNKRYLLFNTKKIKRFHQLHDYILHALFVNNNEKEITLTYHYYFKRIIITPWSHGARLYNSPHQILLFWKVLLLCYFVNFYFLNCITMTSLTQRFHFLTSQKNDTPALN